MKILVVNEEAHHLNISLLIWLMKALSQKVFVKE